MRWSWTDTAGGGAPRGGAAWGAGTGPGLWRWSQVQNVLVEWVKTRWSTRLGETRWTDELWGVGEDPQSG